jgi:hypothetical protein
VSGKLIQKASLMLVHHHLCHPHHPHLSLATLPRVDSVSVLHTSQSVESEHTIATSTGSQEVIQQMTELLQAQKDMMACHEVHDSHHAKSTQ